MTHAWAVPTCGACHGEGCGQCCLGFTLCDRGVPESFETPFPICITDDDIVRPDTSECPPEYLPCPCLNKPSSTIFLPPETDCWTSTCLSGQYVDTTEYVPLPPPDYATLSPPYLHTGGTQLNSYSYHVAGAQIILTPGAGSSPYKNVSKYPLPLTFVGAPPIVNSPPRRAIQLNGSSQYATHDDFAGSQIASGQGFAICAWLKPRVTTCSTWGGIYSHRQNEPSDEYQTALVLYRRGEHLWLHMRKDNAGSNSPPYSFPDGAYARGDGCSSTPYPNDFIATNVFTAGEWTHVVAGRTGGGTVYAYVNGVPYTGSTSMTGAMTDFQDVAKIGSGEDSEGVIRNLWDGEIDDFRFYNRAVGHGEALNLYYTTRPGGYGDTFVNGGVFDLMHGGP